MKDKLYIKTRLENIASERVPQETKMQQKHEERLKILTWIYNLGNLRTEEEMNIQLQNTNEELMSYQLAGITGILVEYAKIRKDELENIIN